MKRVWTAVGMAWAVGVLGAATGCAAAAEDDNTTTAGALSLDDADAQDDQAPRAGLAKGATFSVAIGSNKAIQLFRSSSGLWGIEPKGANAGKEGFRSTDEYAIRRGELEPNELTGDEKEANEREARCFFHVEAQGSSAPRVPGVLNFRIVRITKHEGWVREFGATATNSADQSTWLLSCSVRGSRDAVVPRSELKAVLAWRLALD